MNMGFNTISGWRTAICFWAGCIFLFFSCGSNERRAINQEGQSNRIELALMDSLGTLIVNLPERYDTSFAWIDYSDCNSCNDQKYRFQSSSNPIIEESGWIKEVFPKDSVDRFTITHKTVLWFKPADTVFFRINHHRWRSNLLAEAVDMNLIADSLYQINGRYFSVFELEGRDATWRKELLALTNIHGNDILFSCQLAMRRDDSTTQDFFERSLQMMQSVVIKDAKKSAGKSCYIE